MVTKLTSRNFEDFLHVTLSLKVSGQSLNAKKKKKKEKQQPGTRMKMTAKV